MGMPESIVFGFFDMKKPDPASDGFLEVFASAKILEESIQVVNLVSQGGVSVFERQGKELRMV